MDCFVLFSNVSFVVGRYMKGKAEISYLSNDPDIITESRWETISLVLGVREVLITTRV